MGGILWLKAIEGWIVANRNREVQRGLSMAGSIQVNGNPRWIQPSCRLINRSGPGGFLSDRKNSESTGQMEAVDREFSPRA